MYVNIQGDVHVHVDEEKSAKEIRNSSKLYEKKQKVKKRDKVCQICGDMGNNGYLEVHHLFPVSKYPHMATNEDNMICLCQKHHAQYHNEYEGNINPITFIEFIKEVLK